MPHGTSKPGPEVVLVMPDSATRGMVSSDPSFTFPIHENHLDIVKLAEHDSITALVVGRLSEVCDFDDVKPPPETPKERVMSIYNGRLGHPRGSSEDLTVEMPSLEGK